MGFGTWGVMWGWGWGGYLLAQGHLFQQGLGARGEVGFPQALGGLGVGAQQVGLEVLPLDAHGVKPACTTTGIYYSYNLLYIYIYIHVYTVYIIDTVYCLCEPNHLKVCNNQRIPCGHHCPHVGVDLTHAKTDCCMMHCMYDSMQCKEQHSNLKAQRETP